MYSFYTRLIFIGVTYLWDILFGLTTSILGSAYAWWWLSIGRWRALLKRVMQQGLIIGKVMDVFLPDTGWLLSSKRSYSRANGDAYTYSYVDQRLVSILRGLIGENIGWNPNILLNPHILIVGASGWGKTSFLRKFVRLIYESKFNGLKLIVFDYLGHFIDLGFPVIDLAKTPLEPLSLLASREVEFNSGSPSRRARAFTEAFCVAMGLGPLQLGMLLQATIQAFKSKGISNSDKSSWKRNPPQINDVIKGLYKVIKSRRIEEVGKLEARLHEILLTYNSATDVIYLKKMYRILREYKGIILDMHALDLHTRIFFTDLIVRRLLDYAQSSKTILNTMLIVDEAKYAGFLDKRSTETRPGIEAALIARNYGVGVVLSSQGIAHFPSDVLRNTAFKIIGTLTYSMDKEYISKTIGREAAHIIENMPRGYSIVEIQSAKPLIPVTKHISRTIFLVEQIKHYPSIK